MPEPQPFYVTTPIYYPNDAPHIGHAYTSVAADALARWRRLWGDDVMFLTGTDEHGTKIERAAEEQGHHAPGDGRRDQRAIPGASRRSSTSPTPTSSAPPSRATCGRCRSSSRSSTTTATSSSVPTRASTAWRARPITPKTSWSTATARSTAGPSSGSPRRTGSSSCRATSNACSITTPRIPTQCSRTTRRNEVLGFIKQGLTDFSMSRKSVSWGIPLPWDPEQTCYVWFDALFNYCTAAGYGTDPEKFARFWPADYHLVGKDILRFHAVFWPAMLMAAGLAAAQARLRARMVARPRREDVEDERQPDRARGARRRSSASTASATTSSATSTSGPMVTSATRRWSARYNSDLANNFGNLANRVLNMAINYCGGTVPDARDNGPLVDAAASDVRVADRGHGTARLLERFRRGVGPHRRHQLLHRAPPAVGAQQGRRRGRDRGASSATASRRSASSPSSRRRSSRARARSSGAAWATRPRSPTERLPEAAGWGRLPAGATLDKGAPLFPRIET